MTPPKPLPPHVLAATRRRTLACLAAGRRLALDTGHGLFSADAIDDGTALLRSHLPERAPERVLDLGCGYGALGLPIAAEHPSAAVTLVDRDLLAVAYAAHNAARNGLRNVAAQGGLDYGDLDARARFDWILCNVPARIGARAIAHLLEAGARRLTPRGELRTVVITDLAATVASAAAQRGLPVAEVARGRRHVVHACGALPGADDDAVDGAPPAAGDGSGEASLYARDEVTVEGRALSRPHDLGEDRTHREIAVPLLLGLLPREATGRRCLVVRPWYGGVALALAARGAEVHAVDRDLLALRATLENAARCGVAVRAYGGAWLPDAVGVAAPRGPAREAPDEARAGGPGTPTFDLLVGELPGALGEAAVARELTAMRRRLAPGGEALWLLRERLAASVVRALEAARVDAPRELGRRDGYVVLRDAPRTRR